LGASGRPAAQRLSFLAFCAVQLRGALALPSFSGTSRKSLHIQSHFLLYMKMQKKSNPARVFHGNDAFFRFGRANAPRSAKK
jgi:hypothetical protein